MRVCLAPGIALRWCHGGSVATSWRLLALVEHVAGRACFDKVSGRVGPFSRDVLLRGAVALFGIVHSWVLVFWVVRGAFHWEAVGLQPLGLLLSPGFSGLRLAMPMSFGVVAVLLSLEPF